MPPKNPRRTTPPSGQGPSGNKGRPARQQAQARPAKSNPAARREAQRTARIETSARNRRRVWIIGGVALVLVVGLIVGLVVAGMGGDGGPGITTPNDGRQHIPEGQTIAQAGERYSTDPPTSGPHWPAAAPRGIYDRAPDERLVHSLEHGYVVIHHNCSQTECPEVYDALVRIYSRYDSKVILNYRPQTEARIALTAWRKLLTLETIDENLIIDFIDSYRNKGPEDAP